MMQRLKGFNLDSFLDSKIAEEQAKQQRAGQASPVKRTPSGTRRASARGDSPAKRPSSRLRGGGDGETAPVGRGPDPSEFVIEDDDFPSRATTPRPAVKQESDGAGRAEQVEEQQVPAASNEETTLEKQAEKPTEKMPSLPLDGDLSQDIQQKLRKLSKLESRYHGQYTYSYSKYVS